MFNDIRFMQWCLSIRIFMKLHLNLTKMYVAHLINLGGGASAPLTPPPPPQMLHCSKPT